MKATKQVHPPPPFQAVIGVALLRFQAALSAADVALMLLAAAASLALLWWRRARPEAYCRWGAWARALQRLVVASPASWKVTQQVLAGTLPYGHGALLDAALYGLLVFFASCGASAIGMVSTDLLPCVRYEWQPMNLVADCTMQCS